MSVFAKIPENTFEQIQSNAGVVLSEFDPEAFNGTLDASKILFATSGGFNFTDNVTYKDMGDGIDNAPRNTKELKRFESREVRFTGTAVTASAESVKAMMGGADVSGTTAKKITPRDVLKPDDFKDFWIVGDYGNVDGGMIAVHVMNALSASGFKWQTQDRDKGQFAFDFLAHYSMEDQSKVPYEVYIKAGTAA